MVFGAGPGVALDRVLAVVASLSSGREQVGSGFLVRGNVVLTAGHCTEDKQTGSPAVAVRVVRASDGRGTDRVQITRSNALDVAVLQLHDPSWAEDLPSAAFARVDRTRTGVLRNCVAVGYPMFQYESSSHQWDTAELHGTIYQTDGAQTGRLLLREPLLATVSGPDGDDSAWGGLSGAVVFHDDQAIGVIIEHHRRQGTSSVQLIPIDQITVNAGVDTGTRAIADALMLPSTDLLPWAAAEPVQPLAGLVDPLDNGDLPLVADLNPYQLGVSASDYGDSRTYGQHDPYVARTRNDVDARLRDALEPGRLALVIGPSKAGKTRTAFEAALACWPGAHLLAPTSGTLGAVAAHPRLQTTSDPILVWLDDLQRFFTGTGPLTPALLTRLTTRPGPTIVLATLRQDQRDLLRDSSGELSRDTRTLLDDAAPFTIELRPTTEDPHEQAAAQAAYPNQDLTGIGLAEELAHARVLLRAYYDSAAADDPTKHTVIRVAIDWERAGIERPIPEPDLVRLTRDVLWTERTDLDCDDEQLAKAIEDARKPLPGPGRAALLITHALAGHVRGYSPFDYLTAADNGQHGQPRPIPEPFWNQVLQYANPEDAADIGDTAYFLGNIAAAVAALREAAAADRRAAFNLGFLLDGRLDPPDLPGARAAYEQAAAAGHTGAANNLGLLLARQLDPPDLPGARAAFEQAAAAGNIDALNSLGALLATRLDPPDLPGARAAYEQAAAAGNTRAMVNLGNLLADMFDPSDLPGARAAYEQAAAAGDSGAAYNLGVLLTDRLDPPDLPAARAAYEQAAAGGNSDAANNLGVLLSTRLDPPDLPGARAAYEQAAAGGNSDAANNLGVLLATRLDPPDLPAARAAFEQAAAAGNSDAANNLGLLLATRLDPPDLPAARAAFEQSAAAGSTDAANSLGILLADRLDPPDLAAARAAFEQAAAAGNSDAAAVLGVLLDDRLDPPDLPAARAAYEQAAAAGNSGAANNLGVLLVARFDPPDLPAARAAFEQAAAAGNSDAANNLGLLLSTRFDPPDLPAARAAYEQAAAGGHTGAMLRLGDLLADRLDPPDLPAARAAYEQAAAAGNSGAAYNLAVLLATRFDPPDLPAARAAFEQAAAGGDTRATYSLGVLLAHRLDPPDLPAARAAFEQAAAAGDSDAAFGLGILLGDQLDPPDLAAARAAYEQAAAAGHTGAMLYLGDLLANQLDPPDLPAARASYEQAAAAGNSGAAYNLAVLLATRFDPSDLPAARAAYEQAAAAGHTGAMLRLGDLLADQLDPPDLPAARAAYEQAAAVGNSDAAFNLGILLAGQLDPPDLPAARQAWAQAAASGDNRAAYNLGVLLADLLDPPDLAAARAAYQQAAAAGDTDGLLGLGSVEAELGRAPEASAAWRAAVDSGVDEAIVPAALNLAALAAASDDLPSARTLLQRAADAGASQAGDYQAVLDPNTRAAACAQLAELSDTHSLNFRGIAAFTTGDQAAARRLWTASRDQRDAVAPLLLQLIATQ